MTKKKKKKKIKKSTRFIYTILLVIVVEESGNAVHTVYNTSWSNDRSKSRFGRVRITFATRIRLYCAARIRLGVDKYLDERKSRWRKVRLSRARGNPSTRRCVSSEQVSRAFKYTFAVSRREVATRRGRETEESAASLGWSRDAVVNPGDDGIFSTNEMFARLPPAVLGTSLRKYASSRTIRAANFGNNVSRCEHVSNSGRVRSGNAKDLRGGCVRGVAAFVSL